MKFKKHIIPALTIFLAVFVVAISFTPLVIPKNTFKPRLFGLPFSLWMGIFMTVVLVILTWIATRVHPEANEAKKQEQKLKNKK